LVLREAIRPTTPPSIDYAIVVGQLRRVVEAAGPELGTKVTRFDTLRARFEEQVMASVEYPHLATRVLKDDAPPALV
jgi:hypothetical protein